MRQNIYFGILIFFFPHLSTGLDPLLRCCRKPPPLVINGKNIFQEKEGSHILAAFVEGGNKDSRKQVRGLDLLLNNFLNMDVMDINFVAINRKNDSGIRHLRRRASFDIYQEPETSNVWEELGVGTNDFVFFDHCGYLVGHVTFPNNFLLKVKGRVCTDKLIRSTYTKQPCKKYWKCLKQQQEPEEEETSSEGREPELFSIVESSNGTFNSPLERT